jgi:curli biogenesis system outer membrane secretion channel CsgG
MFRLSVALIALLLAVVIAGCAQSSSSSGKFQGAEQEVATAIDDLSSAASRKNEAKICDELLTKELAQSLKSTGTDCETEISDALADADDYDLSVKDVTVSGPTATAVVENNDKTSTFRLQKVGNAWRIASIGS